MDLNVINELYTSINLFKTDALSKLGTLIPIAAAVLITVALVKFTINYFQKFGFYKGRMFTKDQYSRFMTGRYEGTFGRFLDNDKNRK